MTLALLVLHYITFFFAFVWSISHISYDKNIKERNESREYWSNKHCYKRKLTIDRKPRVVDSCVQLFVDGATVHDRKYEATKNVFHHHGEGCLGNASWCINKLHIKMSARTTLCLTAWRLDFLMTPLSLRQGLSFGSQNIVYCVCCVYNLNPVTRIPPW